jgi:hypothetical protein
VRTVGLGECEGLAGFVEVGAGDDEFLAAGGAGALEDAGEVGGVALRAVVDAGVDGVGEVDAYLLRRVLVSCGNVVEQEAGGGRSTSIYRGWKPALGASGG